VWQSFLAGFKDMNRFPGALAKMKKTLPIWAQAGPLQHLWKCSKFRSKSRLPQRAKPMKLGQVMRLILHHHARGTTQNRREAQPPKNFNPMLRNP
jgi:hypothetical protein